MKKVFRAVSTDGTAAVADAPQASDRVILSTIEVPTVATDGYATRDPGVQLTAPQAQALRSVLEGLRRQGATLNGGRRVAAPRDAIAWILEQIG